MSGRKSERQKSERRDRKCFITEERIIAVDKVMFGRQKLLAIYVCIYIIVYL